MNNDRIYRLTEVLNHLGAAYSAVAIKSGISPSNLKNMLDGKQTITDKTMHRIHDAYPQFSIDWLKNGNGQMIVATTPSITGNDQTNYTLVPLINIDSVGGMASTNSLSVGEQFIERLIPFTGAKEDDRAIYQTGESMTPLISAGSILHIRKVNDWKEYFGYGGVFVLWLKDDRRITKQVLKYKPDPSNYVTCHSFNPDYADEELPKHFIREVWKVIKVLTDKGW